MRAAVVPLLRLGLPLYSRHSGAFDPENVQADLVYSADASVRGSIYSIPEGMALTLVFIVLEVAQPVEEALR